MQSFARSISGIDCRATDPSASSSLVQSKLIWTTKQMKKKSLNFKGTEDRLPIKHAGMFAHSSVLYVSV